MTETKQQPRISRYGIAVIVMVLALLALMGWGLANNDNTRPQVGDAAPDLELYWLDGYKPADAPLTDHGDTHLVDFQGEIVVLNFWASWCIECIDETPELQAIHEKYKDEGVEVLGVTYTDIDSNSIEFLQTYGATYGNAPDVGGRLSDRYKIVGVPETFVIDQQGTLVASFIGPVSAEQLEEVIESVR